MASVRLGLIAGNGRFPVLFAGAARRQGFEVHVVAHEGETDASALAEVASTITWVKLGQIDRIRSAFVQQGVDVAVMAGGIGRIQSLTLARPDLGALRIVAGMRSLRDDEVLRALARYFESHGIRIAAPTDYVRSVLATSGHLAGPKLSAAQERDVELGREVAARLGLADVGQTVVVKNGVVLAVEAIEGTDECIRRAARYGGAGCTIVKRAKPTQDLRFDLPAAGPVTIEVMRETQSAVLAVEADKTVMIDSELLRQWAHQFGISVYGISMS